MWGSNEFSELGEKGLIGESSLQPVHAVRKYLFKEIACGDGHTIGITKDGELISWGDGNFG